MRLAQMSRLLRDAMANAISMARACQRDTRQRKLVEETFV
jgi:hypothetical protein